MVSPSRRHSSISATIAAEVAVSKQRTGSASSALTSSGPGSTAVSGLLTGPISTVWLTSRIPAPCSSSAAATAPSATRAAVSRAEARSSTGRASSKPYFCIPTRSACPGRGRVNGALRARSASTSGSTGSAAITCSHLGHSVLAISIATGPPWVRACRTPPSNVTWSCSNVIRAPRPLPSRRRASAADTSSVVTRTCAGNPSRIATRAGPWDSPAVSQRSMRSSFHAAARAPDRSAGDETRPDVGAPEQADQSPEQHERPEGHSLPLDHLEQREQAADHAAEQEPGVQADQPLAPAQPAEGDAERTGEPDVAEPEAAWVDEEADEEEHQGDQAPDQRPLERGGVAGDRPAHEGERHQRRS